MNTQRLLLTVVLGILVITTGWTVYANRTNSTNAGFEYKVIQTNPIESEVELNRMGKLGWELVAVSEDADHFKINLYLLRNR
jgi:predicted negative regulator of RcsB-dependent stress response